MKRLVCIMMLLIIVIAGFPFCVASADSDVSFLIDDWSTSDGVILSFYDDGYFILDWGYLAQEEGYWDAEVKTDDTFLIEMEGSGILSLMSLVYGSVNSDYHFEILKCNEDNFYLVQVYGDYTAKTSPCKLGFTRYGASSNFAYTEDETVIEEDDSAETDDTIRTVTFNWHGKDCTIDLHWDWEYFNKSATVYDHNLAMAGLAISDLIHTPDTFESRIKEIFGFEDMTFQDFSTWDTPAYALGHHEVTFSGKKKHIILLALRGTNLGLNGPNDLIDDLASQFDGFRPGTRNINNVLNSYIGRIGCSKNDTILFITGHSLGGAIAQSLAPFAENYVNNEDSCFIYTYAAANTFMDMLKYGEYNNVHNIINTRDTVPYIPVFYGKYGHKWYYDSSDSKYKRYYEKTYNEKNWHSKGVLDEHDVATYFAMMLCDLPDNMGHGAENPYSYTSIHCPVDIEVYDIDNNLMGKTNGDDVTLESNSKLIILADDGKKDIIAPPGVEYTVTIVGTDDGQMTVKHQRINTDTDEALDEKEFSNVKVEKGQVFLLDVNEDNVDNIVLAKNTSDDSESIDTQKSATAESVEPQKNHTLIIILIVAGSIAIICIIVLLILFKIKKKKEAERRRRAADEIDW